MPAQAPTLSLSERRRLFWVCWSLTALYNVAWGIAFPLIPVYYREPEIGLTFQQIGWLGGIRAGVGLAAPLIVGFLADWSGRQKLLVQVGFLLAASAIAGYLLASGFWAFAAITVLGTLALYAYNVPVNALVTRTLSKRSRGRQFGQYRISGSIGFALANFFLLPIVSRDPSYRSVFLTGAVIYLLCFLLVSGGVRERNSGSIERANWSAWRRVLRQRNLRALYLSMGIGAIGSSMGWAFFSNHLDETFGLSKSAIGLFFGLQTLTEIPALILLGWFSDRWGRKPFLVLSQLASFARWTLVGWAPSPEWLVLAQLLWGMAFSGFTLSMALITDLAEESVRTTAIGIINFCWGIGNVLGPSLGGYLADHLGLPIVFRVGALFSLAAGVLMSLLLTSSPPPSADRPEWILPQRTDRLEAPPVLHTPGRSDRRPPGSADSASTR